MCQECARALQVTVRKMGSLVSTAPVQQDEVSEETSSPLLLFFSHQVLSNSLPWTAAGHASLSLTISQSLPKFESTGSVVPSNHHILCRPFTPQE